MTDHLSITSQEFETKLLKTLPNLIRTQLAGIEKLSLDALVHVAIALALAIVAAMVEILSDQFFEATQMRETLGLIVKQRGGTKTITTWIGDLVLRNDKYLDRTTGHSCSPVLLALGITPHQRISNEFAKKLVMVAVKCSFEMACTLFGDLSKWSVKRLIDSAILTQVPVLAEKRKAEVLYVHADEEHAHLQKRDRPPKSGCQFVPLAMIDEGIKRICEGRNILTGKVYFTPEDFKTETLAAMIEGYIRLNYDLTVLKRIVVFGDGAAWINGLLSEFGLDGIEVVRVMDAYHISKKLGTIAGIVKGRGKNHKKARHNLIGKFIQKFETNDWNGFLTLKAQLLAKAKDKGAHENLTKALAYLENNWQSVVNRYRKDLAHGSCTESMVQHVCSARTSSVPMGWSKKTLAKMAGLRCMVLNHLEITFQRPAIDIHYENFLDEQFEELKKGISFTMFDQPSPIVDRNSGTQHLLAQIAACGNSRIL